MAIAVLVIFWVVLGIGVLLVAMAATKKPKSDDDRGSRTGSVAVAVALAALFIVGTFAIPAVVMIDNTDANAKAIGGVHLNDAQVHGRELFATTCAQCHTLRASNAVGETGPNLDQLRPPAALVLDAIKNGRARGGMGQMPSGLLTGEDAKDVASYVQAVAGR
jgi:mono/diheme cytochrome c family protein